MLRFTHYDSLYTSDMYSDDDNTSTDVARQVEIQGSVQSYTSVDIGTKVANTKSNTQFFVDQSIVTLNSPDIEFNTEVQVYGNENLGLRIVGAIPITANASAHAIVAGSAMLESGHNIDTSSTDSVNRFGTGRPITMLYITIRPMLLGIGLLQVICGVMLLWRVTVKRMIKLQPGVMKFGHT